MKGDFTGFSFDGIHSSILGITRVSGGDFYEESLHPDFENKINSVPGKDGEYYFGNDYKSKPIKISIAFDSVTEKQFRLITNLFSTKKLCPLIFDERPYKMYKVKIDAPINLSYVCFDEAIYDEEITEGAGIKGRDLVRKIDTGRKQRIYKGEGEIEFTCVNPFASAPLKTLDQYRNTGIGRKNLLTTYSNVDEWAEASGILTQEKFDELLIDQPTESDIEGLTMNINVYNPGDIDTPFQLYLPYTNKELKGVTTDDFYIRLEDEAMVFKNIKRRNGGETGIMINTANQLVEGVVYISEDKTWRTTGEVYNDCLIKGYFPKIKHIGVYELITNNNDLIKQTIRTNCNINRDEVRLFYDYLYY